MCIRCEGLLGISICVRHMSEHSHGSETVSEGACKGHAERKRLCWYSLAGSDIVESAALFSSLSSRTPANCVITGHPPSSTPKVLEFHPMREQSSNTSVFH